MNHVGIFTSFSFLSKVPYDNSKYKHVCISFTVHLQYVDRCPCHFREDLKRPRKVAVSIKSICQHQCTLFDVLESFLTVHFYIITNPRYAWNTESPSGTRLHVMSTHRRTECIDLWLL